MFYRTRVHTKKSAKWLKAKTIKDKIGLVWLVVSPRSFGDMLYPEKQNERCTPTKTLKAARRLFTAKITYFRWERSNIFWKSLEWKNPKSETWAQGGVQISSICWLLVGNLNIFTCLQNPLQLLWWFEAHLAYYFSFSNASEKASNAETHNSTQRA